MLLHVVIIAYRENMHIVDQLRVSRPVPLLRVCALSIKSKGSRNLLGCRTFSPHPLRRLLNSLYSYKRFVTMKRTRTEDTEDRTSIKRHRCEQDSAALSKRQASIASALPEENGWEDDGLHHLSDRPSSLDPDD